MRFEIMDCVPPPKTAGAHPEIFHVSPFGQDKQRHAGLRPTGNAVMLRIPSSLVPAKQNLEPFP